MVLDVFKLKLNLHGHPRLPRAPFTLGENRVAIWTASFAESAKSKLLLVTARENGKVKRRIKHAIKLKTTKTETDFAFSDESALPEI